MGQEYVTTRSKAEELALDSLPDETTKITNMMELQKSIQHGYYEKPLQMPVVLLTGEFNTASHKSRKKHELFSRRHRRTLINPTTF